MKRLLMFSLLGAMSILGTQASEAPFNQFHGNWILKNDQWQQRWDGKDTETVTIENHHTHCAPVNTSISVLCAVSSPSLNGHILWSFDPVNNIVHHLSSFGEGRNGVGTGSLDKDGNLSLKISFASEGEDTFREYSYTWVSNNEYTLLSTQYINGRSTGNFYGGSFVRTDDAAGADQ